MSPVHARSLRGRRRAATLAILASAVLLAGPSSAHEPLFVAAAASLRVPIEALTENYRSLHPNADVRLSFGASSTLARQIEYGAPTGVFISADSSLVEELAAQDLVEPGSRLAIARNRLVVIRRSDLRAALDRPGDLASEKIERIAMPSAVVPLGHYGREWLIRRGLFDALGPRLVVTEHARATLAAVDNGHVDAAIVYATDARLAKRSVVAFEIDAEEQPAIVYMAALTSRAAHDTEARRYLEALAGPFARAALEEAGFLPTTRSDEPGAYAR